MYLQLRKNSTLSFISVIQIPRRCNRIALFNNCRTVPTLPITVIKIGEWNAQLTITSEPTAYIQPELTEQPVSEVESTCRGDNCAHAEWWLYDIPYLYHQTQEKTGRTTTMFVNMYDTYEGNGVCSG